MIQTKWGERSEVLPVPEDGPPFERLAGGAPSHSWAPSLSLPGSCPRVVGEGEGAGTRLGAAAAPAPRVHGKR